MLWNLDENGNSNLDLTPIYKKWNVEWDRTLIILSNKSIRDCKS